MITYTYNYRVNTLNSLDIHSLVAEEDFTFEGRADTSSDMIGTEFLSFSIANILVWRILCCKKLSCAL